MERFQSGLYVPDTAQLGASVVGRDYGIAVSMSADGQYVAIADPNRESPTSSIGNVYVAFSPAPEIQFGPLNPSRLWYGPDTVDEALHGEFVAMARGIGDIIALGDGRTT